MKLFLISQGQNIGDYDIYASAVVAAKDEKTARHVNPVNGKFIDDWDEISTEWCSGPEHVTVRYLGEAVDVESGVVCAAHYAG